MAEACSPPCCPSFPSFSSSKISSPVFPLLLVLAVLAGYFLLLSMAARRAVVKAGDDANDVFFRAARRAPWPLVAFGMIGASLSGVSMISVPGWVGAAGMSYLQMCMGFIPGYFVVAFVLLPVYYRLRLTSIYGYLASRFGERTHRTGASSSSSASSPGLPPASMSSASSSSPSSVRPAAYPSPSSSSPSCC